MTVAWMAIAPHLGKRLRGCIDVASVGERLGIGDAKVIQTAVRPVRELADKLRHCDVIPHAAQVAKASGRQPNPTLSRNGHTS